MSVCYAVFLSVLLNSCLSVCLHDICQRLCIPLRFCLSACVSSSVIFLVCLSISVHLSRFVVLLFCYPTLSLSLSLYLYLYLSLSLSSPMHLLKQNESYAKSLHFKGNYFSRPNFIMQMSAPDSFQSEAVIDLMKIYGWKRFAIIASVADYGRCYKSWWLITARECVGGDARMPAHAHVNIYMGVLEGKGIKRDFVVLSQIYPFSENRTDHLTE